MRVPRPDLAKVLSIAEDVSEELDHNWMRNAVSGAIAVYAHGWKRYPSEGVEILVKDGFASSLRRSGVAVRIIVARNPALADAIERATVDLELGVRVVPIEPLVVMKLRANRARDRADLVGLRKVRAIPVAKVRGYLKRHAPDVTARFHEILAIARRGERRPGDVRGRSQPAREALELHARRLPHRR